ncbi:hypothetical protein K439DRAFT_415370 [Ramaria rubella]|nr:hypothetical protein K439DRAFT_415370 [Ramaria rubella]
MNYPYINGLKLPPSSKGLSILGSLLSPLPNALALFLTVTGSRCCHGHLHFVNVQRSTLKPDILMCWRSRHKLQRPKPSGHFGIEARRCACVVKLKISYNQNVKQESPNKHS